jgi:hypothetical protein
MPHHDALIYALRRPDGWLKVGRTANLKRRMKELCREYKYSLDLEFTRSCEGACPVMIERRAHALLAGNTKGPSSKPGLEWFFVDKATAEANIDRAFEEDQEQRYWHAAWSEATRAKMGWTIEQMAEIAQLSTQTIIDFESGIWTRWPIYPWLKKAVAKEHFKPCRTNLSPRCGGG